jgi:hypothetical protein
MRRSIFLAATLWLASSAILHAQGFGEFIGTVTDPTGAVIAGAKVTAMEVGAGFSRSVSTSPEGFFTIQSLRPSDYTLQVDAP